MKKFLVMFLGLLFIFFLPLGGFGCKKSLSAEMKKWVGTWSFSKIEFWSDESGENQLIEQHTKEELNNSEVSDQELRIYRDTYIKLKSNGFYETNFVEATNGLASSLVPEIVFYEYISDFGYYNCTWSISNNILFLDGYASWIYSNYDEGKISKEIVTVNSIFSISNYYTIELKGGQIIISLFFNAINQETYVEYTSSYVLYLEKTN